MTTKKTQTTQAIKPRPHQAKALCKGVAYFRKHSRGKLIAPCGTGKSLIGYWLAKKLGKSTVVTAHNLGLLKQSLTAWINELQTGKKWPEICCICSDDSAGIVERKELENDLSVPCFTNLKQITAWLQANRGEPMVVFSTYQSGSVLATACRKLNIGFDVGIIDEAHKTAGALGKPFGIFLHDKNLRINKRVFMTATERRYRGDRNDVLSMENPTIFGQTFYHLSYKEALEIRPKILSDYQIIIMEVTQKEIREWILSNKIIKLKGRHWAADNARSIAAVIALRKAMQKYPITHVLSFHKTIRAAQVSQQHQNAFNQHYRSWGKLETFHVNGKMGAGERKEILQIFEETKTGIVTNARCLIEGLDIPKINGIVFADGKFSTIDTIQSTGRGMRVAPNKKKSYILIPIILEENKVNTTSKNAKGQELSKDGHLEKGLNQAAQILRALATTDDRIIQFFQLPTNDPERAPEKAIIKFDLDDKFQEQTPVETETNTGENLKGVYQRTASKKRDELAELTLKEFAKNLEVICWKKVSWRLAWKTFEEARTYARSLKLKGFRQWVELAKAKKLAYNVPTHPESAYKGKGWAGTADFLGYKTKTIIPFKEARTIARGLKLKGLKDWRQLAATKLPENLPHNPEGTYKNKGWEGWGDFLGYIGSQPKRRKLVPFEEARDYARSLGLKGISQWQKLGKANKLPPNIPRAPASVYKGKGWAGSIDFLGNETLTFEKARQSARKARVPNKKTWQKLNQHKTVKGMPKYPSAAYQGKGWAGWPDFLGNELSLLPFEKARKYARELSLKSQREWVALRKARKLPRNIPTSPRSFYKGKGWAGWDDFLGKTQIIPYLKAKALIKKSKLKSKTEWDALVKAKKVPKGIPVEPRRTYKGKGWTGTNDFLGIKPHAKTWPPFEKAKKIATGLKLKSKTGWIKLAQANKLPNLPKTPQGFYKDKGWKGWPDFLGNKITRQDWIPFEEARKYARNLDLKKRAAWVKMTQADKLPKRIPRVPNITYQGKGWTNWKDFLGRE